ncbi:MAG: four helix bundle protein [Limisphaerales bacterium]
MSKSIIREKSLAFALDVIEVYKKLIEEREFVLSKQLLRFGTSIGANIEEAIAAQSRRDFLSKMSIASKEARETRYWLILLQTSKLTKINLGEIIEKVDELVRILTSIVKTTSETSFPIQISKLKIQN